MTWHLITDPPNEGSPVMLRFDETGERDKIGKRYGSQYASTYEAWLNGRWLYPVAWRKLTDDEWNQLEGS